MLKVYTENLCTAVIEDIVWDRIHIYFTVKVDYPDNPMPDVPLHFYGVNGKGLARIRFRQEERKVQSLDTPRITIPTNHINHKLHAMVLRMAQYYIFSG